MGPLRIRTEDFVWPKSPTAARLCSRLRSIYCYGSEREEGPGASEQEASEHSVGKMPDSVLQLDSAAADRNTETVSANSAAGWRRFLASLPGHSLLAGFDACDLADCSLSDLS